MDLQQLGTNGLHLEKLMISGKLAYIWELAVRLKDRAETKLTDKNYGL
jgi:hypothetical protein